MAVPEILYDEFVMILSWLLHPKIGYQTLLLPSKRYSEVDYQREQRKDYFKLQISTWVNDNKQRLAKIGAVFFFLGTICQFIATCL
jgi:hypothetical protein